MSSNFPVYPDDRSNEFGSANDLETSGGVFDSVLSDDNVTDRETVPSLPNTQVRSTAAANIASDPAPQKHESSVERSSSKKDTKKHTKKDSGIRSKVLYAVVTLAAVFLCVLMYIGTHAVIGDFFGEHVTYSSGSREIDLSGSDYSDYSQLSKLDSLEVIDLTNSSFSDLSDLYKCENLKKVILADRELSAEECIEFYRHVPGARLICNVNIGGRVYTPDTESVKLENADSDTQKLYAGLHSLVLLDLTDCNVSDDTYMTLAKALPECDIVIRTVICGTEYINNATSLKLEGAVSDDDLKRLQFFKNLNVIDVKSCTNPRMLDDYIAAHPDVKMNNPIEILGRQFGTEDEIIDLRGGEYTLDQVKAALDETLPRLKNLKKIDMCGCGFSNKDMEQLCEAYPSVKFVWMVKFAKYQVRTDAVVFSALNSNGQELYDQYDYAPLFRYCTDLRALDLGHSLITDISAIASLKKLRAVILTDNIITNISAFAELEDLEFIEMNSTNKVSSVEPLKDLKNLKYINLWGSVGLTDLSPLYAHKNLKLVIFERTASKEERARFMESNPDCETYFDVDRYRNLSTNAAWRENPYRVKLKSVFGKMDSSGRLIREWKYVVGFDEETEDYIVDYTTDQYKYV